MPGDELDRSFRLLARGIRSRREVVDFALADVAYRGGSDLLGPLLDRLLAGGLEGEVRSWIEWDEGRPDGPFHYMPFRDSRLIVHHFGDPSSSTPEQRDELRDQLRSRVRLLATMVRGRLDRIDPGSTP